MSRRKNIVIFIAIMLLCFLLLTQLMGDQDQNTPALRDHEQATGSPIDPIIQGYESIELTAAVHMKPEEFNLLSEWNEEFQQLHPGTVITLTNLTYEQSYLYLKEQAKAGQSPNIMMLDNNWISEFAARGYLSHRTKDFTPSDSGPAFDQAISQTEWNGYTWAVPKSVDPYIVVWNPMLLLNEGESELPESLGRWQAIHQSLLLHDPTYEGIYVNSNDEHAFISMILAFQGKWSNERELMYTLATDHDKQLLEQLMSTEFPDNKDGLLKPLIYMQPLTTSEAWEKFANNQFSAMVVPLSEWMARQRGDEVISISLLGGSAPNSGLWLSGSSYAVSSQTLPQEIAYSWVTWMTNLSHQIETMKVAYKLPVNVTTLDSNSLISLPYPEMLSNSVKLGMTWSQDPLLSNKLFMLKQAISELVANPYTVNEWNEQLEHSWKQVQELNP